VGTEDVDESKKNALYKRRGDQFAPFLRSKLKKVCAPEGKERDEIGLRLGATRISGTGNLSGNYHVRSCTRKKVLRPGTGKRDWSKKNSVPIENATIARSHLLN